MKFNNNYVPYFELINQLTNQLTMETEVNYVSFGILDDLEFTHKKIKAFKSKEELIKIMNEWWKFLFDESYLYWNHSFDKNDYCKYVDILLENNHIVWNRVEKYHVVCFAINFKPFNIWSKECDAQEIDWKNNIKHCYDTYCFDNMDEEMINVANKTKSITNVNIPPSDYNENPVIKFMKSIANYSDNNIVGLVSQSGFTVIYHKI